MTAARLSRLGLRLGPLGAPTLVASFAPPRPRVGALVLIPHGRTPSNQRLIFQDHSEGPDATLLPESLVEAGKGAEVFPWTPSATASSGVASGGRRCTAARRRGASTRRPLPAAAWRFPDRGRRRAGGDRPCELARQDRGGARGRRPRLRRRASGGRRACEASGRRVAARRFRERAAAWVEGLDAPGRVVVAFGHGTMQNAIEVVLRTYGDRPPAEVFTRVPGKSHLRAGSRRRVRR